MKRQLSKRFDRAIRFAAEAHGDGVRKGTNIPYFCHLLQVAGLVLEYGGNEDAAIAALLHDTIEDCGVTPKEIGAKFGRAVCKIVVDCSDSFTNSGPKRPWEERKKNYLAHLSGVSSASLLVSACDKLHNARATVRDVRIHGKSYWKRFNAPPARIVWFYTELHRTLWRSRQKFKSVQKRKLYEALVKDFKREVQALRQSRR